jgi:hypothetical protein
MLNEQDNDALLELAYLEENKFNNNLFRTDIENNRSEIVYFRYEWKLQGKVTEIDVWNRYVGSQYKESTCDICNNDISINKFAACYVVPKKNGGKAIIENLRAVCLTCRNNLTNVSLRDYCERYYPNARIFNVIKKSGNSLILPGFTNTKKM